MKGTARRTKLQLAEDLESRAAQPLVLLRRLGPGRRGHRRRAPSRATPTCCSTRWSRCCCTPVFPGRGARQGEEAAGRRDPPAAGSDLRPRLRGGDAPHLSARPTRCIGRTGEERIARVEALDARRPRRRSTRRATAPASLALVVVGDVDAGRVLDGLEQALCGLAGGARAVGSPRRWRCRRAVPGPETVRCPTRRAPTSSSRCPRPDAHGPRLPAPARWPTPRSASLR